MDKLGLPSLPIGASRERGVVLVMALVILLILTILGVTAMSTSSLQEKMAGNTQEQTKAFQAAESGISKIASTSGTLDLTTKTTNNFSFGNTTAKVDVSYMQSVPPKRGSGYSSTSFDAANFDQQSAGKTVTAANVVLHRGVAQIVPKQ
jgi:type IV pilus assembly protein PilX